MRNSAGFLLPRCKGPPGRQLAVIYTKKPLTLEQQADRLLGRGLVADRDELIARLKVVNYYRLSGYLHPFRQPDDSFIPGTTLEKVWRRYNFDRRLRIMLLDAVERIEVAVRTRLVYHFVQAHGPFGHLDARNLPGFKAPLWWKRWGRHFKALTRGKRMYKGDHKHWLGKLDREMKRASGEAYVKHFRTTYGSHHKALPLWMACELMTCDSVLQFANAVEPAILKKAAADFGFPDQQFLSWAKAVFSLRNACAHHARVWNRAFGVKPSIPGKNKNPQWHVAPAFAPDRAGLLLTVCHHWLSKVSTTTQWKVRLFALFDEYPEIPLVEMGIPAGWRQHPLWM
jgi:abortive infection bacteriophage resistance protein